MGRSVPDWIRTQPIAHRGFHDAARGVFENTLGAFAAAAQRNYAIELDVLLSKDGEAMVFHDDDLSRLCGRPENVEDLNSSELASVLISGSDDTIPTLGEVLTEVDGRVPLLVEIKSDGAARGPLEARVAALLDSYRGPAAVQSFDPRSMAWFAENRPALPRGQLSMRYTKDDAPGLTDNERAALTALAYNEISRPDFVAYQVDAAADEAPRLARAGGLPLLLWTVTSQAQWERARADADNLIFEGFDA